MEHLKGFKGSKFENLKRMQVWQFYTFARVCNGWKCESLKASNLEFGNCLIGQCARLKVWKVWHVCKFKSLKACKAWRFESSKVCKVCNMETFDRLTCWQFDNLKVWHGSTCESLTQNMKVQNLKVWICNLKIV